MGELVYVSEVRIERQGDRLRHAYLPAEEEPIIYGSHGAAREQSGYPSEIPDHATALDHVVAAAAGCMTGTFAGALTARGIDATGLIGHARGEIESVGKVKVIKRTHLTYAGVDIPKGKRETAERALTLITDPVLSHAVSRQVSRYTGWG